MRTERRKRRGYRLFGLFVIQFCLSVECCQTAARTTKRDQVNQELFPQELFQAEDGRLTITWNNGQKKIYSPSHLRKLCPCATCREKRREPDKPSPNKLLPVLSLAEAQPLTVIRMRPVGNYAYNIAFSDGHDSGIFAFEALYECGQEFDR